MALIWNKTVSGVRYEVRSAGNSLRLYTDGVFHSQYNSRQILTGHVWDLLMIPAFFLPEHAVKRVLVLGVGGGAVLHMLRYFISPEYITGVELNPVHLQVARRFFDLKHASINLIEADAIGWLKDYRGEKFDIIIDDLFTEKEGEPIPVVNANRAWFSSMLKHLTTQGIIVRNFISKDDLLESAGVNNSFVNKKFASIFQLSNSLNENYVGVYAKPPLNSALLRKNLIKVAELNVRLKTCRLNYRIRQLK